MNSVIKYVIKSCLCGAICAFIAQSVFASSAVEGIQIYQKNLHLSPEHKQKLVDDISRYRNADNLWDVLRDEFAMNHYEESPAVQEKILWYMNNQDFLLRSASRAAPYLYYISQQVKKRHLPAELVLLPIIESGYNPFSLSHMGAAGIWQLMPSTATGLGVKRNSWYDGRRDVIASTRAALNYLSYLQTFFEGNWLFAIAAYNTGEGNLLSAIKRNIRDGIDTDFWSLPVAQETRDYVPSLLALAVIISNPDRYPIYFPPVSNAPYLAQVDVGTQINLKYAASLAGISYNKLMQLNSGYKSPSTSNGPYKLVLPIENVEQFTENLAKSPLTKRIDWIHYKVKSGDTIVSIAKKYTVSPGAISKMNHLSKNTLRPGASILIPNNSEKNVVATSHLTPPAPTLKAIEASIPVFASRSNVKSYAASTPTAPYTLQPGDTVYMVRSNDSLQSIAKHFRINPQALQAANQLSGKKVIPGKQIIIPTHEKATELASANTEVASMGSKSIQPGDTIYMVRREDTIDKIASKFRTTASAIRVANLMPDNALHEGDRLVVPTHMQG